MRFVSRRFRLLGFLFLAAMLAFGQQQAALHLLGHAIEQVAAHGGDDRSGPPADAPESVCAKCLALAHLDHVVDTPIHATVPAVSARYAIVVATIAHIDLAPARAYESRAPPRFS